MNRLRILAFSGSCRETSTNTILLKAIQSCAPDDLEITLYQGLGALPIFNPDDEGLNTPASVNQLCSQIASADGLLIASPEYVRAIPGGLKNAIDWLVSRQEVMSKPIALAHASYRGDDMLASLRSVLSTITDRFDVHTFLRIPLNSASPITTDTVLDDPGNKEQIEDFIDKFVTFIRKETQ